MIAHERLVQNPTRNAFRYIRGLPEELADVPIFVATDDTGAVEDVAAAIRTRGWRSTIVTTAAETVGHDEAVFQQLPVAEREAEVIRLLANFRLLCQARYFVGTFTSNVGLAVHVARRGEDSRSADVPFRFVN